MTHAADADVIVIGAGAAGLAAARRLAARSLGVLVLEARDRVGGRAWSAPTERAVTPAELGAEFIHGRAPQTIDLLREAGSAAIDAGGEGWIRNGNGELQRDESDFGSAAALFDTATALSEDESVEAFLQRIGRNESMRARADAARTFVEGFDAAIPAVASVRAIAHEWRSGVDSRSARPLGGYGRLFDFMRRTSEAAGVRTHFATSVRRIAWHRSSVSVETEAGAERRTFTARAVILTLPAGVLCRRDDETAIAFDPALPAKQDALRAIEMGHVVKIVLRFQTPFWEEIRGGRYRDGAFFRCEPDRFPTYWTLLPVRSELVMAWTGGPRAVALKDRPRDELVEYALTGFGEALGEPQVARQQFETAFTHDWASDPFARGAYSYIAVGGEWARAALATPVDDTLFFAGEATSIDGQGGTVNGALETGERAAEEVEACLKRRL